MTEQTLSIHGLADTFLIDKPALVILASNMLRILELIDFQSNKDDLGLPEHVLFEIKRLVREARGGN